MRERERGDPVAQDVIRVTMNQFFKTFLACLLALVVGGIGFILVSFIVLAGVIATLGSLGQNKYAGTVAPHTVLQIDLAQPIVDKPNNSPLDLFDYNDFSFRDEMTLFEAVTLIEEASQDPHIDGIYLNVPMGIPSSISTLYELRQALTVFRESGKFILSYADLYSQGGYYLASVADRVYLNPQGEVAWIGIASNILFYKGLLDKLGIQAELIRHGAFKGAGEPFVRESLSPENRLQTEAMTSSIWNTLVNAIAQSRQVAADTLQAYASRLAIGSAEDARRLGLVDSLYYRDQLMAELARLSGKDSTKGPELLTLQEYKYADTHSGNSTVAGSPMADKKIALVYADGDIVHAGDPNKQIVGNALAETLAEVRQDSAVKAVVMRVNSPGGSALDAEIIWREVHLTQQVKPVIVSMGNYAASGGYYISCGAEYIVTTPTTLTGSIGVFGLTFNVGEGAREHLGLTTEVVKTNPSADMGNIFRPMSTAERRYMQRGVDSVYARFLSVVASGRNLSRDSVDRMAGGRVWTGAQAMENGLADGTGTLSDAIRIAADHAGLALGDYYVWQYPSPESSSFAAILGALTNTAIAKITASTPPLLTGEAQRVRTLIDQRGIKAAMPLRLEMQY